MRQDTLYFNKGINKDQIIGNMICCQPTILK